MARKDLLAVAHVFDHASNRDTDDEFLDRLHLPAAPRRADDVAWEPKVVSAPKVIAFPEDRASTGTELRRLEQTIAEMSAQIGELTIVVDELRETLAGFQEDLPPVRWRIPLRASQQ